MVTYTPKSCSVCSSYFIKTLWSLLLIPLFILQASGQPEPVQFDQAQNGKAPGFPISWTNGILNATHTTYYEGVATPQRLFLWNLQNSGDGENHTVKVRHLAESGGKHAYDFLVSWEQAIQTATDIGGTAGTNELTNLYAAQLDNAPSQFTGANAVYFNHAAFTTSNPNYKKSAYLSNPLGTFSFGNPTGTQGSVNNVLNCWMGTYGAPYFEIAGNKEIESFTVTVQQDVYDANYKIYTLTWKSESESVLILFAGHPAIGQGTPPEFCGYGLDQGAGSVSGGNYHIKLTERDGTIGERDNQVMANTFQIPPPCNFTGPTTACANTSITFTAQVVSGATYHFTITDIVGANPTPTSQSGSSNTFTVNVGSSGGTFTVNLTTETAGGSTACTPINVCVFGLPAFVDPPGNTTITCAQASALGPVAALSYTNGQTGACAITGSVPGTRTGSFDECGGTLTESWTFTDNCGRTINHSRTITVEAAPAPTFTGPLPGDITADCGEAPGPSALSFTNGQSGDCSISGSVMSTQTPTPGLCGGPITETWTFTDDCGRTITHSRTITVGPPSAPTFATPGTRGPIACSDAPPAPTSLSYTNGETGACAITGSVLSTITGSHTVCGGEYTESWTFTDDCGRTINASRTITVNPAPQAAFINPPGNITAEVCNVAPVSSALAYSNTLTGTCGISGTVMSTITGGDGNCGVFTESWTFTDICGRTITHSRTITVPCCITFCTYTQGAYGNAGGQHCTPHGPMTTAQTISYALNKMPDDQLVIGRPGRSLTIRGTVTDDIQAVIDILPGGGQSKVLDKSVYASPTSSYSNWLKNGRLQNSLLAQTITLGLNMFITENLQSFELKSDNTNKYLVTLERAEGQGCEIEDPDAAECAFDYSPYEYRQLNAQVIQYLKSVVWNGTALVPNGISDPATATVRELFELASAVLGGVYGAPTPVLPNGMTMESISSVADDINNVFDECRIFDGYQSTIPTCPVLTTQRAVTPTQEVTDLKLAAYPNPYNNTVSFNFTSPVSGKALLEVYDIVGKRLAVVFEGQVDAGMRKVVNYNVPSAQRVPMIYRLSIGSKTSFGKLLPGTTD